MTEIKVNKYSDCHKCGQKSKVKTLIGGGLSSDHFTFRYIKPGITIKECITCGSRVTVTV